MKLKKPTRFQIKQLVFVALLFIALPLVILSVLEPQRLQQFAQTAYNSPPLFGCLHTGEADDTLCGTKIGRNSVLDLKLHNRELEGQLVYYGDTLTGTFKYTNIEDQPINIKAMGIAAQAQENGYPVEFQPIKGGITLEPSKTVDGPTASYKFDSPDPAGGWLAGPRVINTAKQSLPIDKTTPFQVNATCTALRVKELTSKDKSNLQSYCGKNKDSKLCGSRQYCEIFKGKDCNQKNVSENTPGWQCDTYVYMPKPEQDLLEELCKVYPDTDACANFCDRTIGSSICPDKYLVIDGTTGKPVTISHPKALYVRDPNNIKFTYAKDYPPKSKRVNQAPTKSASQSASAAQAVAGTNTLLADGPMRSSGGLTPDQLRGYAPTPLTPKPLLGTRCGARPCEKPTPVRTGRPPEVNKFTPGAKGAPKTLFQCPPPNTGRYCTNPNVADPGDFGYAPECRSGRRDQNPNDDTKGVNQFACCLNSGSLREGCCSGPGDDPGMCTAWTQKVKPDGSIEYRDGANNVCANVPKGSPNESMRSNTCGKPRSATVPRQLEGTDGANPPSYFIPVKTPNPNLGNQTPVSPPPDANATCKELGNACKTGDRCCGNADCLSGTCQEPKPGVNIPDYSYTTPKALQTCTPACGIGFKCQNNACIKLASGECTTNDDCTSVKEVCQAGRCVIPGNPKGAKVACVHNEEIIPEGYQNMDPSEVQRKINGIRAQREAACCATRCQSGSCSSGGLLNKICN